jgi:hypothetical protein
MEYAVPLRDIDAAWKDPAARLVVESVMQDDPGEVVKVNGTDAIVLTGPASDVAALVRGLLGAKLRVFSRQTSSSAWSQVREAPTVDEVEIEDVEFPQEEEFPRIDEEFAALCGKPTADVQERLRASLIENGLQESLKVWKETDILLDGHSRLSLLRELGIKPRFESLSFATREKARNWIMDWALLHKPLARARRLYFVGKLHLAERKDPKATTFGSRLRQVDAAGATASRIGRAAGLSKKTVERCAAFAQAVDRLAEVVNEDARSQVLAGQLKLTHEQMQRAIEGGARSIEDLRAARRAAARTRDPLAEIESVALRLVRLIESARGDIDAATSSRLKGLWAARVAIDSLAARDLAGAEAAT